MASAEIDVISHLLDVEKNAALMISGAEAEADRRAADCKARAEADFKKRYDEAVAQIESGCESKMREIKERREEEIALFKSRLQSVPRDQKALAALLDDLLAAE